jgi:hypothetical protein
MKQEAAGEERKGFHAIAILLYDDFLGKASHG